MENENILVKQGLVSVCILINTDKWQLLSERRVKFRYPCLIRGNMRAVGKGELTRYKGYLGGRNG